MLIGDMFDVWKRGKAVADPALWKNIGATTGRVSALATAVLAVATAFGYRIDMSDDLIQAAAMGIAAVLYAFTGELHITTSEKVGMSSKDSDTGGTPDYSNSVGVDPNSVDQFFRNSGRSSLD